MAYQKRELLLVAGVLFLTIGLLGVGLPLIYSVIISVAIYVGIKFYVNKRKQSIANNVGQGICMDCGGRIADGRCPNCGTSV